MMLRYAFAMKEEAAAIETAVEKALSDGLRTADIAGGAPFLTTTQMTDEIIARI